jgi:transposase-like protein
MMSGKGAKSRRSFLREKKLEVVEWFYNNSKNIAKTSRQFGIDRKQVRAWISSEKVLRKQKKEQRSQGRGRRAQYELMEERLYEEFLDMRQSGKKVKRWWFNTRGHQILKELQPDANFKFSDHWFWRFQCRHKIALRARTHTAQQAPSELCESITDSDDDSEDD